MKAILLITTLLTFSGLAHAGGSIVFQMQGFRTADGSVRCAIFSEEGWLKDAIDGVVAPIENGRAVCTFRDLPAGDYGIVAHHDRDDNEIMRKTLGIPREPYCFSRNAKVRFGPPSFAKAGFHHDGQLTHEQAKLK